LQRFFTLLRHLVAIAILPGTVVVLIPLWIVDRYPLRITSPFNVGEIALVLLGCALLATGGTLFVASLRRFAGEGQGTLAPGQTVPRTWVDRASQRMQRITADDPFRFLGLSLAQEVL